MNENRKEILRLLQEINGTKTKKTAPDAYIGNHHKRYAVNSAQIRMLVDDWYRGHKNISFKEFISLLDVLSSGESETEKFLVGSFLSRYKEYRKEVSPEELYRWLGTVEGWAEVDVMCQSTFMPSDLLDNWGVWKKALINFSQDKNIHRRRASLVILANVTRKSPDQRLSKAAFDNVDRLKGEKEILITKAVSWVLRSLIRYHKSEVDKYLVRNEASLPKIAVREARNKLKSGRKSGK